MLTPNTVYDYLSKFKRTGFKDKHPIRVGSHADGGYILLDHLLDTTEVLYSYGISTDTTFEVEFCYRYGCTAHLYDHTIDKLPHALKPLQFHQEGIDSQKTEQLDTLMSHVSQNNDLEKNLVCKMDVEGAEFEALLSTPDHILQTFNQMVIELHGIDQIDSEKDYSIKSALLTKLNVLFYMYHTHAVNYTHSTVKCGYRIPQTIEITLINRKLKYLTPALPPPLPLTIDRRNKANRVSHGLNYWPFTQDDFIHQPCISYRYLRPTFMLGKLKKCIKSIYSGYQVLALSMRKY